MWSLGSGIGGLEVSGANFVVEQDFFQALVIVSQAKSTIVITNRNTVTLAIVRAHAAITWVAAAGGAPALQSTSQTISDLLEKTLDFFGTSQPITRCCYPWLFTDENTSPAFA